MAQRFSSGLQHTYADNNVGRFFHRYVVEFLTQIAGWSVVDKAVGTKWDNVAASGSGTAETLTSDTIKVTSPGYAFSSSSVGGFLTISGFSSPNETRDGIYKIRKFISVAGNDYTMILDTVMGVHSDGLPVQAGLNWRFWLGNDTYCPTTNDVCVIGGLGYTGASLATGTGIGDDISGTAPTMTLTDAGALFVASDVGKYITISGATGLNNGRFPIASYISPTQITYTNASGFAETYSGTWTLDYPYHVHMKAGTWYSGFGEIRVAPWASWNAGTHNWNDLKYTAAKTIEGPTGIPTQLSSIRIWAEVDSDHASFFVLCNNSWWSMWHFGELDTYYPAYDPRPCVVWVGCDSVSDSYNVYHDPVVGYRCANGHYSFYYGMKGLSHTDVDTLTYYAMVPNISPSSDVNFLKGHRRQTSTFSNKFYKIPILVESRTAGSMEVRGQLRKLWATGTGLPLHTPLGSVGDYYYHVLRGLLCPWNGSRNAFPGIGFNQYG